MSINITPGSIKNNVLIGKSNQLYLHEGNYNQFSFLGGKEVVTDESKDNFVSNIRQRQLFANGLTIPYLHVVIPCKPLVAREDLPPKYRNSLTSIFLRHYAPLLQDRNPIQERVLYPLGTLLRTQVREDCYWKNDTHINAAGQLSLYREIGKYIPGLSEIFPCFPLTDVPRIGDLSLMLGTDNEEMSRCFSWMGEALEYSNTRDLPGNTGDIVIKYNPLSLTERRIAILGDSFIKTILHLFSQDFRTILYIRGPYFQPDIIKNFKPDILITSETERYLAGVDSDNNGTSLLKYARTPLSNYKPNSSFLNALEAQLSFNSEPEITKQWEREEYISHELIIKGFGIGMHNHQLKQLDSHEIVLEATGECPVIHFHKLDNNIGDYIMIEIESNIESTLTLTVLRDCPTMTEPLQSVQSPIKAGEQTISISIVQNENISGILIQPLNAKGTIKLGNISFKKDLSKNTIPVTKHISSPPNQLKSNSDFTKTAQSPKDTQIEGLNEVHIQKIDPHNILSFLENSVTNPNINHLVFDSNDSCNADCVYCPNTRSNSLIEESDFHKLVNQKLGSVKIFQFGCGQEPTLDRRLPRFFEILNQSKLTPQKICMITNGTRLHQYDLQNLINLGLCELQISIDTIDRYINDITRKKTDLDVIKTNLKNISQQFPKLSLTFSIVVNSLSIHGIEHLIDFGETINVKEYILREVWDFLDPEEAYRNKDYKTWMKNLSLYEGQFSKMCIKLSKHSAAPKMQLFPANLQETAKEIQVK